MGAFILNTNVGMRFEGNLPSLVRPVKPSVRMAIVPAFTSFGMEMFLSLISELLRNTGSLPSGILRTPKFGSSPSIVGIINIHMVCPGVTVYSPIPLGSLLMGSVPAIAMIPGAVFEFAQFSVGRNGSAKVIEPDACFTSLDDW